MRISRLLKPTMMIFKIPLLRSAISWGPNVTHLGGGRSLKIPMNMFHSLINWITVNLLRHSKLCPRISLDSPMLVTCFFSPTQLGHIPPKRHSLESAFIPTLKMVPLLVKSGLARYLIFFRCRRNHASKERIFKNLLSLGKSWINDDTPWNKQRRVHAPERQGPTLPHGGEIL